MKKLMIILFTILLFGCQTSEKEIKTDEQIVAEFVSKIVEISPNWIYTGAGYVHDMYLKAELVQGERISFAHFFPRGYNDCWGEFVLKDYSLVGTVLQDTDTFLEVQTPDGTIEVELNDDTLIFRRFIEGTQTVGREYALSNIDYGSLTFCI